MKLDKIYFEIQNYIETHLEEDLSLETIANQFYINKYHLSHCFREIAGHTFKQHIVLARISQAKHMLLTSNLQIFQISEQVGFQSASHFIRIFKKYEGISPLQYRSRSRKELQ